VTLGAERRTVIKSHEARERHVRLLVESLAKLICLRPETHKRSFNGASDELTASDLRDIRQT